MRRRYRSSRRLVGGYDPDFDDLLKAVHSVKNVSPFTT